MDPGTEKIISTLGQTLCIDCEDPMPADSKRKQCTKCELWFRGPLSKMDRPRCYECADHIAFDYKKRECTACHKWLCGPCSDRLFTLEYEWCSACKEVLCGELSMCKLLPFWK